MKYVMFEHAGSGNHGCEAIVRTTVKMLGQNNKYFLQTFNPKEDIHYGLNSIANLVSSKNGNIKRNSVLGINMRLCSRLKPSLDYDTRESIYNHSQMLKKNSIALSIGGDNYCYKGIIGSMRDKLVALSAKNIPAVLWGCSIDDAYIDERVIQDLKKYSLITARESLTVETLAKVGIIENVIPCSDPAFTLEKQHTDWNSKIFKNNHVIGINVSDFMGYYNAYPQATYRNFKVLIDYILKNTDAYIALIPHVVQQGNDDRTPNKLLAAEFNNKRIIVADEDYNCMQLKDIISKCSSFIGCRTHSTIAAYSTCVPTLVVGYSVKAKGIAKDIFGDYNDLLVDVREFNTDNDLLNMYLSFFEKRNELKNQLCSIMPEYIKHAYYAADALNNLHKKIE